MGKYSVHRLSGKCSNDQKRERMQKREKKLKIVSKVEGTISGNFQQRKFFKRRGLGGKSEIEHGILAPSSQCIASANVTE